MPSPFPGMDPWLEHPALWPDVHANVIAVTRELLAQQLSPRYVVRVERRVYLLAEEDPARHLFVPDVSVLAPKAAGAPQPSRPGKPKLEPLLVTVQDEVEVAESRLVIRKVGPARELVTAIEVLSPANKTPGSRGREEYLAKRREVLRSSVHLVEIDLLRGGSRVPGSPPGDYVALVSRTSLRPRGEAYVWSVRDALPEIPVPLLEGEDDAALDLARVLREAWDRARYDLEVDYGAPLDVPLRPEDAAWAKDLLAHRSA